MYLILTIFDRFHGPVPYINIPEDFTDEEVLKKISGFMNLDIEKSFFELTLVEDKLKTINYNFEIKSSWARGAVEMAQITILTEKNFKNEIFFDLLKETHQIIQSREDIFKAFYKFDPMHKEKPEIEQKFNELKDIFKEISLKLNDIIESSIVGNILILGLNKVGKSSIIERLKKNIFSSKIKPTLALTLIEQIIDSYHFKLIDVSGQKRLRDQWWSYTKHPDAIIYVVDVSDIINAGDRLTETENEFKKILDKFSKDEEKGLSYKIPLLICLNKIDITDDPDSILKKIIKLLFLQKFKGNFRIQLTSAKTGEGIEDGFKWLVIQLLKI